MNFYQINLTEKEYIYLLNLVKKEISETNHEATGPNELFTIEDKLNYALIFDQNGKRIGIA